MPRNDAFVGITEFLAVARHGSFRKAAHELEVSPGAMSQAIQALEARLKVPLFSRTTRSVALTEAGERLLARVEPAAGIILDSLDDVAQLRATPTGTLRLLVQRFAAAHVIEPILPAFRRRYPDVRIEVTVTDENIDLVGGGHDAGLRIGEYIDRDMVAVRVSKPFNWQVYGAPAYFAVHGHPARPEDLARHECIRYRRPDIGDVYRWEFERDGQSLAIDPPGHILVNDAGLARRLAVEGLGLTYGASINVEGAVAAGLLVPTLETFTPAQESIFIYFPRTSRNQLKLRAFVDMCAGLR